MCDQPLRSLEAPRCDTRLLRRAADECELCEGGQSNAVEHVGLHDWFEFWKIVGRFWEACEWCSTRPTMCAARPIISCSPLPIYGAFSILQPFSHMQLPSSFCFYIFRNVARNWNKAYRDLSQGQKLQFQARACRTCKYCEILPF